MKVTKSDRIVAAAWWVAAIFLLPFYTLGFFHGGFLIAAALWAIYGNLDVRNPFQRSRPRPPEQAPRA
jgi:hypothetical protein